MKYLKSPTDFVVNEGLFDLFKKKKKPTPKIPTESLFREIGPGEWTDYMESHKTEAWNKPEIDYLKSLSEYIQFRKKGVSDSAIDHFYIQLMNKEIRITKYKDEWYDINYKAYKKWESKHTFYLCDTWVGALQCIDYILKDDIDGRLDHRNEGLREFGEYGSNYRKPIIDKLEELLLEIFDKYYIPESPKGVSGDYSWWNDMDKYITIGNIPDDSQASSILADLFQIKEKVEQRLNRKVSIRKGQNGSMNNETFWISITP